MTMTTTAGHESADPRTASEPLRMGVLGAARIAELAIVKPARATGTRLVAIAARDQARASAFATEHGVERALASYADVVGAPDVEAVYNPLPNALHGTWNLAAIDAGRHVLSEKPFAANAEEAAEVAAAAHGSGLLVVEGFHYLYHPVTRRLHELLASGDLGELLHVETTLEIQDPGPRDPRWSLAMWQRATPVAPEGKRSRASSHSSMPGAPGRSPAPAATSSGSPPPQGARIRWACRL